MPDQKESMKKRRCISPTDSEHSSANKFPDILSSSMQFAFLIKQTHTKLGPDTLVDSKKEEKN